MAEMETNSETGNVTFEEIIRSEKKEIDARRLALNLDPSGKNLSGLAISGGGIRSATFALGVLQALAYFKILRKFDYLSTVSGGGYIGSWLSAWHHRLGGETNQTIIKEQKSDPDFANPKLTVLQVNELIEKQLQPNRIQQFENVGDVGQNINNNDLKKNTGFSPEPEPIRHLRSYSNYMAPRLSLFSADGWVLVATYLRNFLLNLCVLILLFTTVFLFLLAIVELSVVVQKAGVNHWLEQSVLGVSLASLFGSRVAVYGLIEHRKVMQSKKLAQQEIIPPDKFEQSKKIQSSKQNTMKWQYRVGVLVLTMMSLALSSMYLSVPTLSSELISTWNGLTGFFFATILACANAFDKGLCCYFSGLSQKWRMSKWCGFSFLTGFAGGWIVYPLALILLNSVGPGSPYHSYRVPILATCLPTILALAYTLVSFVQIGFLGRSTTNDERELWAAWNADIFMITLGWFVIFAAILVSPFFFLPNAFGERFAGAVSFLPAGWASVVFVSLRTAMSSKTSGQTPNRFREVVAKIGPWVFLIGFVMIMATICHVSVMWGQSITSYTTGDYLQYLNLSDDNGLRFSLYLASALILLVVAVFVSWRVDVNIFSMNAIYGNRLLRCYLGATRPKRLDTHEPSIGMQLHSNSQDNPFRNPGFLTGLDPNDDLLIRNLACQQPNNRQHPGPYHIINTALNLSGGAELAWTERMADSFILSPLYCGSGSTGYTPTSVGHPVDLTNDYAGGVTVGQAVSISGAAVSPNMGYHSTPAVTALLTLFNARMGAWLGNPKKATKRSNPSPTFGLPYLLKEVFSRTTADSNYVYLSDGGHFENLGVYELIRRRCKCILAIDGGADPNREFEDLSNLVRKVRIDFGIRIDVDIEGLEKEKDSFKSYTHVTAGRIRYCDIDRPHQVAKVVGSESEFDSMYDGILIYIKLSMTGDESTDVEGYRKLHSSFPHEPTSDQFFSESQFESYRTLGYHIGHELFENLHLSPQPDPENRSLRSIFDELYDDWHPVPRDVNKEFAGLNDAYLEVQGQLRSHPDLKTLERECNRPGGVVRLPASAVISSGVVRTMVTQMLTLLENVFYGLKLDENWDVSTNTGWRHVFATWLTSPHFTHHAREVEQNFSSEFRRFVVRRATEFERLIDIELIRVTDPIQPFPIMLAEIARN